MSNDPLRERLLGTWKLVSAAREEIPWGRKTDMLRPDPAGYINCGRDGRMIVVNVGSDRQRRPARTRSAIEAWNAP